MTTLYRETQMGRSIVIISFLALLYIVVVFIGSTADLSGVIIAVVAAMALIVATFYRMIISVDEECVEVVYGIGLIRKRVAIESIEQMAYITPSWWVGAGIRFYNWGWLYSINFTSAVEFTLRDRRWRVAVGSGNPKALCEAVALARERRGVS
ncbi:MAG: hypothetical protein SNH63_06095 [Rikenellaceae bacterium]